jgi:hypothetical protein
MDSFRTQVPLDRYFVPISHQDQLLSLGSCFAESIGDRLAGCKFNVLQNPFGMLFNPISIAQSLQHLMAGKTYVEPDLVAHQGLWHSMDHHSRFSYPTAEEALGKINTALRIGQEHLAATSVLLLTLGSAHVWTYLPQDRVVANCHKFPTKDFTRRRLTVNETVNALREPLARLLDRSPKLRILLTVSPVRYLRDGFTENQLSKATLLLAIAQLGQELEQVHYFPAYELLMDDLRDYRFYSEDLIHPSTTAVNYIWNYFSQVFFQKSTQQLIESIHSIVQATQHRPFQPLSAAHQRFVNQQLSLIAELEALHPGLDLKKERIFFQNAQVKPN